MKNNFLVVKMMEINIHQIKIIKKKSCLFCGEEFLRLDRHDTHCSAGPNYEVIYKHCQYCHISWKLKNLVIHASKCHSRPGGEKSFDKFLKEVSLNMKEIDINFFNDDLSRISKDLRSDSGLSWKMLNTGSYYSRIKVSTANEFDYMFCPTQVECQIETDPEYPCYCKVVVTNKKELPDTFGKILEESGELFPSKYKDYCFDLFDSYIEDKTMFERKENESTSPAYTVTYTYDVNKNPKIIDVDWVPCLKVQNVLGSCLEWETRMLTQEEKENCNIYVVAKEPLYGDNSRNLWRLSFSEIEKKIIRKKCSTDERNLIRIIKKILEEVKNDDTKICSYHIVTHCLHWFNDIEDKFHFNKETDDFRYYTLCVIDSLIDKLESRNLPHFFISDFNMLSDVNEKECKKLIEKLNHYKTEWTKE